MSACIGLGGDPLDLRRPPDRLVETYLVVDVFQLYRLGSLSPGASAVLEIGPVPCRVATDAAGNLTLDGQPIRLVPHPALPLRAFECPGCERDCYRLYRVERWLCRRCAKLDYSSRHRHRSVPGLHRARWLRQRIGAGPLFSRIESKPLQPHRHWRLACEIREIEERLIEHLRVDVGDVLERRLDADRRRGRR
jgi:hypothetical protein